MSIKGSIETHILFFQSFREVEFKSGAIFSFKYATWPSIDQKGLGHVTINCTVIVQSKFLVVRIAGQDDQTWQGANFETYLRNTCFVQSFLFGFVKRYFYFQAIE